MPLISKLPPAAPASHVRLPPVSFISYTESFASPVWVKLPPATMRLPALKPPVPFSTLPEFILNEAF